MRLNLKPEVLRWARGRAGFSMEQLARKFDSKKPEKEAEKIRKWETTGEISVAQLDALAKATHTPVAALYLSTPPKESLPIADFRATRSKSSQSPSPDLLQVLDDAFLRQEWYRENALSEGFPPLDLVRSMNVGDDITQAARRIRSSLDLTTQEQGRAESWQAALNSLAERIENSGVLVMRSGIVGNDPHRKLDSNEFQGFALADKYAPLIFVNAADFKAAQMFTLIHELVHIWLGVSAIVGFEPGTSNLEDVERFCNSVAAEVLVPGEEALRILRTATNGGASEAIAKAFKVSTLVALIRLRELEHMSAAEFRSAYNEERARFLQELNKPKSSGGDFQATERIRIGTRFARALLESVLEGRTPYREAFQLLGLKKIDTFRKFAQTLDFSL